MTNKRVKEDQGMSNSKRLSAAHQASQFEMLEPRLLLSATPEQIAAALDLPGGAYVDFIGEPEQVQARSQYTPGGLLGMPFGNDADFLILSTGDAADVDTVPNIGHGQGIDLLDDGEADEISVYFEFAVPASPVPLVLKFDYIFLSEEWEEWRGSDFDDVFEANVIAFDGGVPLGIATLAESVNSSDIDFEEPLDTTGTFFDGRTNMYCAGWLVPAGATSVGVELWLSDASDGIYDSAALVDNFRLEPQERIYLDFDGQDVGDLFGWGTNVILPAFDAADLRIQDRTTAEVIDEIVAGLDVKFGNYAVEFVTTQPAEGQYNTVVIGGSEMTPMHLAAILQTLKGQPANTTLGDYFDGEMILGMVDGIDTYNLEHDNFGAVLSGEFTIYGTDALGTLVSRVAHEVGHMFGMRDVDDPSDLMYPDVQASYMGHDSFTYATVADDAETAEATVYVTIGEMPMPRNDDMLILTGDGLVEFDVMDNDTHPDPLQTFTITDVTDGDHGTVTIANDGETILYLPGDYDFTSDTFTYTLTDDRGLTGTATVTVYLDDLPEEPLAYDDYVYIARDSGPVVLDLLANDVPRAGLVITEVTSAAHGTVTLMEGESVAYQPDSPQFRDNEAGLTDDWTDDADFQNAAAYLATPWVGLRGGDFGDSTPAGSAHRIMPLPLNIAPGVKLYDVTLVVTSPTLNDITPAYVHLDTLTATTQVNLPVLTEDATVQLFAASRAGGPIDVVSGTPELADGATTLPGKGIVGTLPYDATAIDIIGDDATGTIPLAKRRSDGQWQQMGRTVKQAFVPTEATMEASDYYAANGIDWLLAGRGQFIDADGDVVTVQLSGEGRVAVMLNDPDGDGEGAISHILLEDTTVASRLTISAATPRGGIGDGMVEIGEIIAPELGGVSARDGDLVDKGIQVAGLLGSVQLHDLLDGSGIRAGGEITQQSTIQVNTIWDDVDLQYGSAIRTFKAAEVGYATIEAAGIRTMTVAGDFYASVTLGETPGLATTLGTVKIGGDMIDSTWVAATGDVRSFIVEGAMDSCLIRTSGSVRTFYAGGMAGSNLYVGVHQAFTALAGSDQELPNQIGQMDVAELGRFTVGEGGFYDSNVAARHIDRATIQADAYDNFDVLFGISAGSIDSLSVPGTLLSGTKLDAAQTLADDDLRVLIL